MARCPFTLSGLTRPPLTRKYRRHVYTAAIFIGSHHVLVAVVFAYFDQASLPIAFSFGVLLLLLWRAMSPQAIHGDQQLLELWLASQELKHRRLCWCWSSLNWVGQGDSTRARLLDKGGCTRAAGRGAVRSRAQPRCPVQLGEWGHAGVHRQSPVHSHQLRHSPAAKPPNDTVANPTANATSPV